MRVNRKNIADTVDDSAFSVDDANENISNKRLARGLFYTAREYEKHRLERITTNWPDTFLGDLQFHTSRFIMENRYRLIMYELEEKHPKIYRALVSVGFPTQYRTMTS